MIICEVNKNHLNVRTRELLTAGSQNVNTVEFRFNSAWDGLTKTATFKTSKKTISVLLGTNTTEIPWEVLADAGEILAVGVFGVSGETIVLPTVWGILGKVMDAAHLGDEEKEPTPDVYQKILDELNALERPTWDAVQNKPFSTLGSGLEVDENGVLSAEGGGGGSPIFHINITSTTDDTGYTTYSADKTADEIIAAYESGAVIIGVYDEFYMPCARIITDTTHLTLIFWIQGVDYINRTVVDRQFLVNINIDNKEMDVSYKQNKIKFDKGIVFMVDNNTVQTSPNSGSFREILYTIESAIQLSKSIDVILLKGDAIYNLSRIEESGNGILIKFDDVANSKTYIVFADVKNKAFTYSEEPLSTSVNITYDEETGNLQIGG